MVRDGIYAPYKIAALVDVISDLGYDPDKCLAGTGLSRDDINNPDTRTSISQYLHACDNAIRQSQDPKLPFLVGQRLHLSAYGMYGYVLMCCANLREVIEVTQRFHRLATPTLKIEWQARPYGAAWVFSPFPFTHLSDDLYRFLLEQQLTQHITHLHDLLGPDHHAERISVPYPAPAHANLYDAVLECPVEFNQPACELHLASETLEQPPKLANRITAAMLQKTCEELMASSGASRGTSKTVYEVLSKTPGHFPNMEQTAALLKISSRTLSRRLNDEGTSFSIILDDIRCRFAKEYLRNTNMTTDDIAFVLGFADGSSFRHAFKKWTGSGVGSIRKKLSP